MRKVFFLIIVLIVFGFVGLAYDCNDILGDEIRIYKYDNILKTLEKCPEFKILERGENYIKVLKDDDKDDKRIIKFNFNSKDILYSLSIFHLDEIYTKDDFNEMKEDFLTPEDNRNRNKDDFVIFERVIPLYSEKNIFFSYFDFGTEENSIYGIRYYEKIKRREDIIILPEFIDNSSPELYLLLKKNLELYLKEEGKNEKKQNKK